MKYAIINNSKEEAKPKLIGFCPYCGEPVIAKCGTIKIWHWSHSNDSKCDPWHENETEWHRRWKNYFPIENQEILHYDKTSKEKHIADIKTNNGTVIEFQNSAISEHELKSREKFYGKMFWIINAEKYLKGIEFTSRLPNPFIIEMDDLKISADNKNKYFITWLLSKNKVYEPGELVEIDNSNLFTKLVNEAFNGYHYSIWRRPVLQWFFCSKPVIFDFGGELLYKLIIYPKNKFYCFKEIDKKKLIIKNGGKYYT
jgi:competence protein CoiA